MSGREVWSARERRPQLPNKWQESGGGGEEQWRLVQIHRRDSGISCTSGIPVEWKQKFRLRADGGRKRQQWVGRELWRRCKLLRERMERQPRSSGWTRSRSHRPQAGRGWQKMKRTVGGSALQGKASIAACQVPQPRTPIPATRGLFREGPGCQGSRGRKSQTQASLTTLQPLSLIFFNKQAQSPL